MDDWPGDPIEDAKMTAESIADLGRKNLPIHWRRIENALRADDGLPQEPTAEGNAW